MAVNNSKYKIKTPHAAVLVWNYVDRIGSPTGDKYDSGVKNLHGTEGATDDPLTIISTLSCVSIQTSKTKSQPDGQFNLVLAPSKNWTSTLTAGSWCVLLMSNEPINETDLKKANKDHVKMIGRIETVRCETSVNDEGARQTLYYISGVDWGYIFNSILYIDNLIASQSSPQDQRNDVALALRNALFGKKGSPEKFYVYENLMSIMNVMGQNLAGFTKVEGEVGRLAKTIYEFEFPTGIFKYFSFVDAVGKPVTAKSVNRAISLIHGSLHGVDMYAPANESVGFLDPFSFSGSHSLWQIMLENSNPALNEMFTDMQWSDNSALRLGLYSRIRPFSYKNFNPQAGKKGTLKSYFQFVKKHEIDPVDVIAINAGTNWRDKFNFIEIKPQFQEMAVIANWHKQKSQTFDKEAFKREGFRPLIFDTKQFPSGKDISGGLPDNVGVDWSKLEEWALLLREWYFGTHRMLNGTITLHGTTEYIGVGNNIKFPTYLINPTPNINSESRASGQHHYILAHIESVSHSFGVSPDGARTYRTTVQFVRGIIVNEADQSVDEGLLDQDVTRITHAGDYNDVNTFSMSDASDPNSKKVKGR